jgi:hypothetical protein
LNTNTPFCTEIHLELRHRRRMVLMMPVSMPLGCGCRRLGKVAVWISLRSCCCCAYVGGESAVAERDIRGDRGCWSNSIIPSPPPVWHQMLRKMGIRMLCRMCPCCTGLRHANLGSLLLSPVMTHGSHGLWTVCVCECVCVKMSWQTSNGSHSVGTCRYV